MSTFFRAIRDQLAWYSPHRVPKDDVWAWLLNAGNENVIIAILGGVATLIVTLSALIWMLKRKGS